MKNIIFVDDEPNVLQGLQRQLHGMRHEWTMNFFDAGSKALAFLESSPADVVVSDMMMPGMDGAMLLSEVMRRHPNTIRIVLSGHADHDAALRLVDAAHQFLSKPCNAEEVRTIITRALALRDLLTSEPIKRLVTRVTDLPTLPKIYQQLTKELQQESPSISHVAEIISRDLGMTAKILRLVNSAFFGLPHRVTSVPEAAAYLGLATLRSLVLSLQVFSEFEAKKIPGFSLAALAEHGLATGLIAQKIVRLEKGGTKLGDECLLAGLLHDVGKLVLAAGLPEAYGQVLATAQTENLVLHAAELAVFEATHAEIGAYLLGLWGLPHQVVEAVALHHRPEESLQMRFSPVIAVHVANALVNTQANRPGGDINLAFLEKSGLADRLEVWREHVLEAQLVETT